MSESNPEAITADPEAQGNPDPEVDESALGDAGKKALDSMKSKWKSAEQQASALQKQLDDIAAANLSDLERAQKAAQDAQETAAKATHEALCLRIAAKHGISDEDADLFLTGSDAETVERQAAALVARTSATGIQPGPRPDLSQGSKGGDASDPRTAFAQLLQQLPG